MRRWRRIRLLVLGLAILLVAGLSAFCIYLQSTAAAQLVARELSEAIYAPVRIESLRVGFSSSTIQSVEITPKESNNPWVRIEKVGSDLSFWKILRGSFSPNQIQLIRPSVTLRFDENGTLVTSFPRIDSSGQGAFPLVQIEQAQLAIQQTGKEEVVFHGINATLRENNRKIVFEGTVSDRDWGQWLVNGSIDPQTSDTIATLKSSGTQVNPFLLVKTPFVPLSVWQNVQVEGKTPAEIQLTYDGPKNELNYRVELEPSEAKVHVTSIGLRTENTDGHLIIENGLLTLTEVEGRTSDGLLQVNGTLDFRKEVSDLQLRTRANRLDVSTFPPSWGIPKQLKGRLSGRADLSIQIPWMGNVRTDGRGRAVINDATLAGFDINPITLNLHPAKEGFVFAPVHEEPEPIRTLPTQILKGIAYLLNAAEEGKKDTSYITLNLNLSQIQLAEILKQFEIPTPVKLSGPLDVSAQLSIPTDTPDDWKSYRIRGTVKSSILKVEDLSLEQVQAKINMMKGEMYFEELSGTIAGIQDANKGSFRGTGTIQLTEKFAFRGNLEASRVALALLEQVFGKLPVAFQGETQTTAGFSGTLSPFTIQAQGSAGIRQLQVGVFPLEGVQFRWSANSEQLDLQKIEAVSGKGKLTGNVVIPFREQAEGSATLTVTDYDLSELSSRFSPRAKLKLDGKASGSLLVKIPKTEQGKSRSVTAEIDLQAPKLKLQNLPAERIKGTATYRDEKLNYLLTGETLGGKFEIDGQYPPGKVIPKKELENPPTGRLKLQNLRLTRLMDSIGYRQSVKPLEGEVSLEFPYRIEEDGSIIGVGNGRIDRLRWKDQLLVSKLGVTVRLTNNELRLEGLSGSIGSGSLRGSVVVNRTNPDRSRLWVRLDRVPSKNLLVPFSNLRDGFDLPIDLYLSGTIGSEVRTSGTISSSKGKVFGVPVADLRIPIDLSWIPSTSRGELRSRSFSGNVARGPTKGNFEVDFFSDLAPRLKGELQFTNVNAQMIAEGAEEVTGNNPISGRLDFASDQLRSSSDLKGNLQARFGESKPFQLPVLSDLVPFLGLGSSFGMLIREGEAKAILAQGVWRIQEFKLIGPTIDLMAEGTLTLQGRLNLDVVARTRAIIADTRLLELARLATPLTRASLPLRVATEASRILSNRVVHLEVTGTLKNRQVRLKPLAILSEEAIRFFLQRALDSQIPSRP